MQPMSPELRSALVAESVEWDFGADLHDSYGRFVEDISADVLAWTVERSNYADIHGTCTVELQRDLAWGKDRLRPWLTISDTTNVAHRFYLGEFVMVNAGPTPPGSPKVRTVTGYDKLWLLRHPVGDTWVAWTGTTVRQAVSNAVGWAGAQGEVIDLGGDEQHTVLPRHHVWCPTEEEQPTYLTVINDLLRSVAYRGMWADERGRLRSGKYQSPQVRPVEWTLDLQDQRTNIVGQERALSEDVFDSPNWWRFVRRGMTSRPSELYGIHTVDRIGTGTPRKAPVRFLDAANQQSLVDQGNRIVEEDTQNTRLLELELSALPFGHFDLFRVVDAEMPLDARCHARSWSVSSDGSARLTLEVLDA